MTLSTILKKSAPFSIASAVLVVFGIPHIAFAAPVEKINDERAFTVTLKDEGKQVLTSNVQLARRTQVSPTFAQIRAEEQRIKEEKVLALVNQRIAQNEATKKAEQEHKRAEEAKKVAAAKPVSAPRAQAAPSASSFGKEFRVTITAYSSTVDQTDSDPFTTASGMKVRDGIIAFNGLSFGTKVMLPDYFGGKVFVVADRTARRFSNRADIWMPTRGAAIQWGIKHNVRLVVVK